MATKLGSPQFPPLRRPNDKVVDPGTVRLGDSFITAEFPPLRRPDEKVSDPGAVRLGDSFITAEFPPHR